MAHEFDPGPVQEPFASLAHDYPGVEAYPADAFRVEWGPIFHRGRLDGSARLLVIGQDPAASEAIVRRILVGAAGHRTQGLLAKLGFDRSYVMVNAFVYSVYGQQGGAHHAHDAPIVAYRNRWLDAIFGANQIEAVIALGQLADGAWSAWKATSTGQAHAPAYAHVTHPTQPESSSGGDPSRLRTATAALFKNWNAALQQLHPHIAHPDAATPLVLYGSAWVPGDLVEIPERDVAAGLPAWMRSPSAWAQRTGASPTEKRRTITVTIPAGVV